LAAIDLLLALIIDRARLVARFAEICDLFWSKLIVLIRDRNLSIAVSATRAAFSLFQFTKPHAPNEHHLGWLDELVSASEPPSVVRLMILTFVVQLKFTGFKFAKIVKLMIAQGLREMSDFWIFRRLLLLPQIDQPLPAIQFLFHKAYNDRIFGRSAGDILREPLARFADLQAVVTWMTLFLRRTFVFVGVSAMTNRYGGKRMRILSLFESLQDTRIEWINKSVIRYYSSLVNSERLRHNIAGFGIEKIIDHTFIDQIDDLLRQSVSLKRFFDYDTIAGAEIPPPATTRPVVAHSRPAKSKTALVKKTRSPGPKKTGSPRLAVPKSRPAATLARSRSLGVVKRKRT
jgi:hypothetical protein